MKILDENDPEVISQSVGTIDRGEVLLYPTDTVYGLGVDPNSRRAVQKLFALKKRDADKMPLLLASDKEMVERFAVVPESAEVFTRHWPAPLTLVLPRREGVLPNFFPEGSTLAFRVPDSRFCQNLLQVLGRPLISTSANVSGKETLPDIESIARQLSERSKESISLAVRSEHPLSGKPSTIVDCTGDLPVVLRQGEFSVSV